MISRIISFMSSFAFSLPAELCPLPLWRFPLLTCSPLGSRLQSGKRSRGSEVTFRLPHSLVDDPAPLAIFLVSSSAFFSRLKCRHKKHFSGIPLATRCNHHPFVWFPLPSRSFGIARHPSPLAERGRGEEIKAAFQFFQRLFACQQTLHF